MDRGRFRDIERKIEERQRKIERKLARKTGLTEEGQPEVLRKHEERVSGILEKHEAMLPHPGSDSGPGRGGKSISDDGEVRQETRRKALRHQGDGRSRLLRIRTGTQLEAEAEEEFEEGPDVDLEEWPQPLSSAVTEMIRVTAREVQAIGPLAFNCSLVTENPSYRARADATALWYLADPEVNAYATDQPLLADGEPIAPPAIVIKEGLCLASRMVAAGLACYEKPGEPILHYETKPIIREIGEEVIRGFGSLSTQRAVALTGTLDLGPRATDRALRRARSIAAGTLLSVIAHELGHICLNHTLGTPQNLEVSRNQEREADSFASSVLTTSPFSDYSVLGGVLFSLLLSWVEASGGVGQESTHPLSLERLFDFIRANKAQAEELGLTPETIVDCLPRQMETTTRRFL